QSQNAESPSGGADRGASVRHRRDRARITQKSPSSAVGTGFSAAGRGSANRGSAPFHRVSRAVFERPEPCRYASAAVVPFDFRNPIVDARRQHGKRGPDDRDRRGPALTASRGRIRKGGSESMRRHGILGLVMASEKTF